jgi:putrescine aminotransferase
LINVEHTKASTELLNIAPSGISRVFFANTGAEAVEVALKLARLNGKRRVIAMDKGFHGKTFGALSVTSSKGFRQAFLPLLDNIDFVEFGNIAEVEALLMDAPGEACVIVEPVQGEGGVRFPPVNYIKELAALCLETGSLLIVDEIQTGMGRLGQWWGVEQAGITPDILLAGKALGGGVMPVSAVLATEQVFRALSDDPFLHSSTFAANPLAMVAVQASIQAVVKNNYLALARQLGESLLLGLQQIALDFGGDLVVDIRGQGLLLGIEFCAEYIAADFVLELMQRRVITCHSLNNNKTVRLTPPVILSEAQVTWLFTAISESLSTLVKRHGNAA